MGNPDISTIHKKVDQIRWDNYRRDYDKQHNVEKLYWLCVVNDILSLKHTQWSPENWRNFELRFYESFLGTFAKAHTFYQGIRAKFNGLHKSYRVEETKLWEEWHQELIRVRQEQLGLIVSIIKRNYKGNELITATHRKTTYTLDRFDESHDKLEQKVSNQLKIHLNADSLAKKGDVGDNTVCFPYDIHEKLIAIIQEKGYSFAKAMMTTYVLKQVDKKFDDTSVFKAYKRMDPKEAVMDLLGMYPEYRSISRSALTDIIYIRYRDGNGDVLKKDSIRKVLSRDKD